MKIYYLLILIIAPLFLSGCLNKAVETTNTSLIVADEKFCIAHTESNISSDEAYKIASQSECAKIGIVKEDCNCDNITYTCSFTLETDKPDCNPICVVNLKTQKAEINWQCSDTSKKE